MTLMLIYTKVSVDASSFGLGAVILQRTESKSSWKPVAYASCTMTDTERHYAQIEKEVLALTWGSERFSMYLSLRLTINHLFHY